ncbi:MAG: NADPH-dependent FMN reductase [Paenibacillaceae bacterium]
MSKVIIVSGSPNPASRLTGINNYVEQRLTELSVFSGHLAVVTLPAEDLIFAKFNSPAIIAANALVESADAVIIASPVYKASFSGVLKTYLDLLPQNGLSGKIVTPLFIGGTIAHLLTIDYALKPVLSALGANHFGSGVYAVDNQVTRVESSGTVPTFELHNDLKVRIDATIEYLNQQLGGKIYA